MSQKGLKEDIHITKYISTSQADIYFDMTLVKSAYQKRNFLISKPKHMLLVLKRTVSMGTQMICYNRWVRFHAQKFYLSKYSSGIVPASEPSCMLTGMQPS